MPSPSRKAARPGRAASGVLRRSTGLAGSAPSARANIALLEKGTAENVVASVPVLPLWRRLPCERNSTLCRRHDGQALSKPVARPPGQGLSSSTVNVLWGFFNLVVGYVLICHVGDFELKDMGDMVALGLGVS